jgi:glycosyltransferase involved in cell wall biosynthesis
MRIAFDAKRALNNGTGLGNHARILLNALMRDYPENEYLLFAPKAKDEFFHQLNGDFKLLFPETKFQNAFHPLWRSLGLTKTVLRERCDIFHGISNELPFNIHRAGIKTIVTIHDLIFLKHTEQYPWFDRQVYTLKTKYAAKHADKIIAVSNETKRDLVEIYGVQPERITVIYPSIDERFYHPQAADKAASVTKRYNLPPKYILNVGSFYTRKNQIQLIEAFDRIKNDIGENLVLAGGGGNILPAVKKLIADKNLEGRVQIISNISNDDLPAVYQSATIFVFPSLFEGFGAPVLEALFSKVPVIATKSGAIKEAAGSASLFINPRSAEDIADKILLVLKDNALRNKMIESGYTHAQTMTDTIFASKTMEVYKELMD